MTPLQISLSIFAITAIIVVPHLELIPNFGYSVPLLLFVWLVLRYSGEKFSDIGFRFNAISVKAALVGSVAAVAILSFMQLLVFPLLELFIEFEPTDVGLYDFIREGKAQFIFIVVMAWLIGGFYEEIVFHGFIFTRLEMMVPGRYATASSFVVTSVLFGAYHLQLGPAGMLNALLVGAVYLGLFLYFKRNLWASIICHGVYNTLVITLIYFGHL